MPSLRVSRAFPASPTSRIRHTPLPAMRFPAFFRSLSLLLPLLLTAELRADARLAEVARKQIGVTILYDPAYVVLDYPGGDVEPDRGVCTDVIIRALRELGYDLQKEVHEDMRKHFSSYPKNWGLKRPDRNIDHRRVPNLECFFQRKGWRVPVTDKAEDYLPGDIVTCLLGGTLPHIMIVSDRKDEKGIPLIIHNIGAGTQEEANVLDYEPTGHFRPELPRPVQKR